MRELDKHEMQSVEGGRSFFGPSVILEFIVQFLSRFLDFWGRWAV